MIYYNFNYKHGRREYKTAVAIGAWISPGEDQSCEFWIRMRTKSRMLSASAEITYCVTGLTEDQRGVCMLGSLFQDKCYLLSLNRFEAKFIQDFWFSSKVLLGFVWYPSDVSDVEFKTCRTRMRIRCFLILQHGDWDRGESSHLPVMTKTCGPLKDWATNPF